MAQPRRHAQMEADMKKFAFISTEGDPMLSAQKMAVINSLKAQSTSDTCEHISHALNFTHHHGSDPTAEMKVIKIILVREGQLMTLHHLHEKIAKFEIIDDRTSLRILETLAQLRDSTLNYLEALCLWRQSIRSEQLVSTRPFMWEGRNYTLRIVQDLDFLAGNAMITSALKIAPQQLLSNPLMLTNNLSEVVSWMEPTDRAAEDTGGQRQGAHYEARLKLRYAERILLQEMQMNALGEGSTSISQTGPTGNYPTLASYENSLVTQERAQWGEEPLPGLEVSNTRGSPQEELAVAYLLPVPGYDPTLAVGKNPNSPLGSRPESRTANSATTPGALARKARGGNSAAPGVSVSLDSGLRGASGQLPPVDPRVKASLHASGLFAPENEFPSPPGGNTPPDDASSNRPVSRSVLLKSGIEVTPYHTEVVTTIYKYPLLVALLTSKQQRDKVKKDKFLESITKPTLSAASKSRDEYDDFGSNSMAQRSLYTDPNKPTFDRLVVKIFDVIGHSECIIHATIAEYVAFRTELQTKYEGNVAAFFVPEDRDWWKENIKHLIRVQLKRNGMLHMTISKQSIEELVVAAMKRAAEEIPSMKFGRRSTRTPSRRSVLNRNSVLLSGSQKPDRDSTSGHSAGVPVTKSRYSSMSGDSERAVVLASALEDDYEDFDFDG